MSDAMDRGRAFAEKLDIAQDLARSRRVLDFGQRGVAIERAQIQRLIGVVARQSRGGQGGLHASATQAVPAFTARDKGVSDRIEGSTPSAGVASVQQERVVARTPHLAGETSLKSPKLKLNLAIAGAGVIGKTHRPDFGSEPALSLGATHVATPVSRLGPPIAGEKGTALRTPLNSASGLSGQTSGLPLPTYGGRGETGGQPAGDGAKVFSAPARTARQMPVGVASSLAHARVGQQAAQMTTRAAIANAAAGPAARKGVGTANAPSAAGPFERQHDEQGAAQLLAQNGATTSTDQGATRSSAPGAAQNTGAGPTEGDVYLDGTLLGRWMARTLAAQAARPASGGAGFDLRRGVFPTGTMIGG